eukprot:8151734-Alexandrium_andersonii.AAC.1
MSASLVGSEMCIRDRVGVAAGKAHHDQDTCNEPCKRDRGATVCCEVPVSYTHLTLPTICSV